MRGRPSRHRSQKPDRKDDDTTSEELDEETKMMKMYLEPEMFVKFQESKCIVDE